MAEWGRVQKRGGRSQTAALERVTDYFPECDLNEAAGAADATRNFNPTYLI
jgi:hypothetical protein